MLAPKAAEMKSHFKQIRSPMIFVAVALIVVIGAAFLLMAHRPDMNSDDASGTIDSEPLSEGGVEGLEPTYDIPLAASKSSEVKMAQVIATDLVTMRPLRALVCRIGGVTYAPVSHHSSIFSVPEATILGPSDGIAFELSSVSGSPGGRHWVPESYVRDAGGHVLAMLAFYSQIQLRIGNLERGDSEQVAVAATLVEEPPIPGASSGSEDADALERSYLPHLVARRQASSGKGHSVSAQAEIEYRPDLFAHSISSPHTGSILIRAALEGYVPVQRLVEVTRGSVTYVDLKIWKRPTVGGVILLDGVPVPHAELSITTSSEFDGTETVPVLGGGGAGTMVLKSNLEDRSRVVQVKSIAANEQGEFEFPFAFTGSVGISVAVSNAWPTIWRKEFASKYESTYLVLSMRSGGYSKRRMRVVDEELGQPIPGANILPLLRDDPIHLRHQVMVACQDGWIDVSSLETNVNYQFRLKESPEQRRSRTRAASYNWVDSKVINGAELRFRKE